MNEDIHPELQINEAKALLNAAWNTTDDARYEQLISWARNIIEPLAEKQYPPALWLKSSLPYSAELSEETVDRLHREQLEVAAGTGNADAQFALACDLDEEPTVERSSALFRASAEAGHPYAMWCHGLNLLSGRGVSKNAKAGLQFIQRSADLKFEGAIKFIADAYANGTHDHEKNEEASAMWWKRLSDPCLIHY